LKDHIQQLISQALSDLPADILDRDAARSAVVHVERTRDRAHGDFASNIAMALAKAARRKPRDLAESLVAALPASDRIARVEIAGPGFINFFLTPAAYHGEIAQVLELAEQYGRAAQGSGHRVLVEFVSANPTGPLHVGHGRNAAYGDSVARLLQAAGHEVGTEYYINDAGRQTDILAVSAWLRYLERAGQTPHFPASGYPGDYIRDIAGVLFEREGERFLRPASEIEHGLPVDAPEGDKETYIDALIGRARELLGDEDYRLIQREALEAQLASIRSTLDGFNVHFDRWYSERELVEHGAVAHALDLLRERGHVYEKDGAVWLRTSELGDEKDRVLVRDDGSYTYFASDVAYHVDKLERGFDELIDVWGADHHGYIARVRAAIEALTGRGDQFTVALIQFVTLASGRMGKRSGNFVTLRELIEEAGTDATRFFYLNRSNDQHLEFDIELARSQTADNPVYYIQYAHARVASVFRQLEEKGLAFDRKLGLAGLDRLSESHEDELLVSISRFPEMVESAAANRAPQLMAHYLRQLANDFHTYYNAHTFLVEDAALRNARLCLVSAARQVIANGLALLGVSAPDTM
jgi:arginyl-tRNA synthetase